MESAIKPGTVVRIRDDRDSCPGWVSPMNEWKGKLMTVNELFQNRRGIAYQMKEDIWWFLREDFDIVDDAEITKETPSPSDEDFLRLFGM